MGAFRAISISDIIDVAFVAVLLYTAIVWARRTRAALVVRGIFILAAVYMVAREFDLQLTAWIFQGFFAIFLIIIVVIFQEELRQLFERIATWRFSPNFAPPVRSEAVDVLVRTVADFVKERTGALIVIRGKNPIERHITGGIELNGRISEPLLKSIFDRHSPGHDGAVIVDGNQIARFAAHLPLSKNFQQLSNVGTRHSAALGLAELTDALCIAVSEERGKISVARDGKLWVVGSPQELGAVIQAFLEEKYPPPTRAKFSFQLLKQNWLAKVAALCLALGFWYLFVPGSKTVEVRYKIPVRVANLPPDFELQRIEPPEVNATFVGPRRSFYLFERRKLRVTIDGALAELGRRTFVVSAQNIEYPKELTLQEISPNTVKISVRKLAGNQESKKG
ncbi:MAG: DNA integrity scanning protein DisA nucleotide-binding domain protein [Deltaproteobacteria bacterium]|nr:DNA integrity scanning protein DisA nucleotide-binding domain protein [Deltaproteobacteria bacterium]